MQPPAPALRSPGPYGYIVQLGAYSEKQNAEAVRNRLKQTGYTAVVKPVQAPGSGLVYVIQLKAENSLSRATTLMMQLQSEVPGEPTIVKAPAR